MHSNTISTLFNPGAIKTGCPATPAYKSRFCSSHTQLTCHPGHSIIGDPEDASVTESAVTKKQGSVGEAVVEMLLQKKSTHTQTYYKVCLLCTIIIL